jgi:hypothetical protein
MSEANPRSIPFKGSTGYLMMRRLGTLVSYHRHLWHDANGELPIGWQLHHIDGNPLNNALDNLLPMAHSEHQRLHAGWVKDANGNWLKPCSNCLELKPVETGFYTKGDRGPSIRPASRCKSCDRARSRRYRQRRGGNQ